MLYHLVYVGWDLVHFHGMVSLFWIAMGLWGVLSCLAMASDDAESYTPCRDFRKRRENDGDCLCKGLTILPQHTTPLQMATNGQAKEIR